MFDYQFNWEFVFASPWSGMLIHGVWITIFLIITTTITSFIFGAILASGSLSNNKYIAILSKSCVEILRNIPGVFWLIIWFFMFPMLFPEDIQDKINGFEYYGIFSAVMGLTFNNSPYISDILKSGYLSLNSELIYSTKIQGFTKYQSWGLFILPQMIIPLLPMLNTRMVHNLKNTALAMVISVPELTWQSQEIESITFAGLESTMAATVIYMILVALLSSIFYIMEYSIKKKYGLTGVLYD